MMLLLLKLFGVQRVAGWALRLAKIIVWMGMLVGLGLMLWFGGEQAFERILFYWVVALVILGLRALWRRRRKTQEPEVPQGERTIDGKRVPDKLAMAAFAVPSYSSDGDSVLRGLPDYGKALLKLDAGEFAYVPELPGHEPKLLELTVVEPAAQGSPFAVLRWVGAGAVVVCLVVAGVVIQSARSEVSRDRARIQDMAEQASPQPVAAAEIGQGSTPAPPQLTFTPPPAPVESPSEAQNAVPAPDSSPNSTETEISRLFGKQSGDTSAAKAQPSRAENPGETWRDPSTGLLWPSRDNGSEPIEGSYEGETYCKALNKGGFTGWRLPTYSELKTVWNAKERQLRGGITYSGLYEILWSRTPDLDAEGRTLYETISIGQPLTDEMAQQLTQSGKPIRFGHVLCVHD